MKNTISLSIIVSSLLMTLLFQNCGNVSSQNQIADGIERLPTSANERVVENTNSYSQIIYYKTSEVFDRLGPSGTKLQVDLASGAMRLVDAVGVRKTEMIDSARECEIEADRLESLSSMLASAKLCTDSQIQNSDTVNCAAIAESNLQLINQQNGESVNLLENVCHNGLFLCNGADALFRKSLLDLAENPPENCRPR